MSRVYLVTSKDADIDYGDSLFVEGVFDSNSKALKYIGSRNYPHEFEITSMTVNSPESDILKETQYDLGNEYNLPSYPRVYYIE